MILQGNRVGVSGFDQMILMWAENLKGLRKMSEYGDVPESLKAHVASLEGKPFALTQEQQADLVNGAGRILRFFREHNIADGLAEEIIREALKGA